MTAPQWSPVDDETSDLLTLVADDGTVSTDYEWDLYVECLRTVAEWSHLAGNENGHVINPNGLRAAIAGRIKPQRVGAFAHRALSQGLVRYTGEYVISTDTRGRNSGRPMRVMAWVGDQR